MSRRMLIGMFCVAILASTANVQAWQRDRGKVPGAIWSYTMSPAGRPDTSRTGMFRINGDDIFQPRDRKPTKIGTITGKAGKPDKGDQVRVEFDSLRGSDGLEIKCRGRVTFQSFGEVEGRLIDSGGKHWDFKASRTQE